MLQHKKPDIPILFRGLHLAGNPCMRPSMSAAVAHNIRVMPGNWVRLRGGKKAKKNTEGGSVMQFHGFRDPNFPGSNSHLAQARYGGIVQWDSFDLSTFQFDPFFEYPIDTAYDGGWALTHLAAVANVVDRPVFYNGLGVRNGTNSRPALSSYFAGVVRYFGLDAYTPNGTPSASFAPGAGNNAVGTGPIDIYCGLFHEPTGHFSNGVFCGTIPVTEGTGTITVNDLQKLISVYHNNTEQNELKYVFYATVENGEIPYLILNATLNGPLTAPSTATSQSLSVLAAPDVEVPNGFVLEISAEMPTQNFPPRQMECIVAVNGRLYGIPLKGGTTGAVLHYTPRWRPRHRAGEDYFTYRWRDRDLAGVAWSKAPGDDREAKGIGDPTQCWPFENIKATPNIEKPIWLAPSVNGDAVIVFTPRSTFIMTELSSGMHVFNDISRVHGLGNPSTVRMTDYGLCWLDQRNQTCLLSGDTRDSFRVISRNYQDAMTGRRPNCADYVLSPVDEIDRYQVWFHDGTFICHDFLLRDNDYPEGMAYSGTDQVFTAAATLVDQEGVRFFVQANTGIYTHETQPDTGLIPTCDQRFVNTVDQTITETEINGVFLYNWNAITDWNERKGLAQVAVIGDGRPSVQLGGLPPLRMEWWGDFDQVPGLPSPEQPLLASNQYQTGEDWQYTFEPRQSHRFVFKFGFRLYGHSTDAPGFPYYTSPAKQGDLAYNFYGAIHASAILLAHEGNRP